MKVLLFGPGASWATADVNAALLAGLRANGVEVLHFPLDARLRKQAAVYAFLKRKAKKAKQPVPAFTEHDLVREAGMEALPLALRDNVDAVLAVSGMYMHPDVVELMRRAGLQIAVLFTESPYDILKEKQFAARVHGCWTNERTSVEEFRTVNANVNYVPHGWHPTLHVPGVQPGDEQYPAHDVVFVGTGSTFPERVALLEGIDWTGLDLGLYGHWAGLPKASPLRPFVRGTGPIPNTATAALYRRAKIGLNLYRQTTIWGDTPQIAHAESLNPRAYELARCGVFHLSQFRAEVPEVFGDLVPTFRSAPEAETLIRMWLADAAGRESVAAALPVSVAECSWTERSVQIIHDIHALTGRAA